MKIFLSIAMGVCSLLANRASYAESLADVQYVALNAADFGAYNRPQLPATPPPKYAIGGFVSQSWVKTDNGVRLSGPSDSKWGSFQRTELGLFGTLAVTPNVDVRGMISSFRDGRFERGTPQINYGLLDVHDDDSSAGMRVGWISNSGGFYTDQLNIPQYRDTELAPQGLYKEAYRHLARGGRGLQLYQKIADYKTWTVDFEWSWFLANVQDRQELSWTFFNHNMARFAHNSNVRTLSVKAMNSKGFIVRYDRNDISLNVEDPVRAANDGRTRLTIHRIGVRKYFASGDVIAEVARIKFNECGGDECFYPFGQPISTNISYRHYVTPRLNAVLGMDTYYTGAKDHSGQKAAQLFGVDSQSQRHRSINVGVQWREKQWTYKAELHRVTGAASLLSTENDTTKPLPGHYNVLMLNASYSF